MESHTPSNTHETEYSAEPRFNLGVAPERLTPEGMQSLGRAWQACPAPPERVRLEYLDNVRVRWNVHSNALEGNTLSHSDTVVLLLLGEAVGGHRMRECEEVVGHDVAVAYVQELAGPDRVLTQADVRAWHRLLLVRPHRVPALTPAGQPTSRIVSVGQYKTMPNAVRRVDGGLKHFASPEDTPALMTEYMDWLTAALPRFQARPPAADFPEFLAQQHAEFIRIHPFDDGNGRVGRLITSYLCLQAGFPVSIIPVSVRDSYLQALNAADQGDLTPLRNLLAATLVREVDFGLAVAQGACDPSPQNEHADPQRPAALGDDLMVECGR